MGVSRWRRGGAARSKRILRCSQLNYDSEERLGLSRFQHCITLGCSRLETFAWGAHQCRLSNGRRSSSARSPRARSRHWLRRPLSACHTDSNRRESLARARIPRERSCWPVRNICGARVRRLDPNDPHNAIITDISSAPTNANGKVEYMATFHIVKPINLAKSSHLMWHFVPNRGSAGRLESGTLELDRGDISLTSGWQGQHRIHGTNLSKHQPLCSGADCVQR